MSSNLKVNSLVPATGTAIGIGTTGGTIDFRCPATFGGNVTIGGTLTYDEVINIDSIGIVTARTGLKVTGGQLDVGSNIKAGNAGVITATSFSGSGASLTGLTAGQIPNLAASKITSGTVATARLGSGTANNSVFLRGDSTWAAVTQTTINNNADNRIITGSGTANTLEAESTLTFDGNNLKVKASTEGNSATLQLIADQGDDAADNWRIMSAASDNALVFSSSETAERLRIKSDGTIIFANKLTNSSSLTSHNTNFYGGNVNTGGVRIEVAHNTTSVSGNTASGAFPHHLLLSNYQTTSADNRLASIGFDITTTSTHANAVIAYQATAGGTGDLQFHLESGNSISEKLRITSAGLLLGGSDASNNTTLGGNAGDSIASGGISNTLIGKDAGTAISTGDSNTALGYLALKTMSTNAGCVAVGSNALEVCTGSDNLGIGFAAGQQVAGGTNNCLFGSSAGLQIQAGSHNVAIGRDALRMGSNSNVNYNVVAGSYTLNQLTNAYNNVVIGYNCSGSGTMTGGSTWHSNVVLGYQSGNNVPSAASNIVIGKYTCNEAGSGQSDNVVIGTEAGRYLGNNSNNVVAIGQQAAYKAGYTSSSNHAQSWTHSVAIGYRAMFNATGGPDSVVAIGSQALKEHNGGGDNTSGGYIVAVGNNCMAANEHIRHTVAVGNDAGAYWNAAKGNQHEGGCVFIGGGAGRYQGTASAIIAIGRDSLNCTSSSPASGNNNTAIGARCLEKVTSGSHNVAVSALYGALFVSTGSWNTFMGSLAGYAYDTNNSCQTGSYCVQIGAYTRSSGSSNDYENCFGYGMVGKGANTTHIRGNAYNSNNSSSWSTTSDERIKKNIVDNNIGLDAIEKIRVRNFEYRTQNEITDFDDPKSVVVQKEGVQLGVIAQEIKDVLPDVVNQNTTGAYSVDPDNLTWYLVNAVKELSAEVKSLKAQLNS